MKQKLEKSNKLLIKKLCLSSGNKNFDQFPLLKVKKKHAFIFNLIF